MSEPVRGLRDDQVRRYARHILLPEVGGRGQQRILAAAVAVEIGPGRAAEIAALTYLAAAGVGRLVLLGDPGGALGADEVATGILYAAADAGRPRIEAIRSRIAALNPDVAVAAGPAPDALALEIEPGGGAGEEVAEALVRGGAAASRLLSRIARGGAP